jgi:hypothetical protein
MGMEGIYGVTGKRTRAKTVALFAEMRETLRADPLELQLDDAPPAQLLAFLEAVSGDVKVGELTLQGERKLDGISPASHLTKVLAGCECREEAFLSVEYVETDPALYPEKLGSGAKGIDEERSISWSTRGVAGIEYGTGMGGERAPRSQPEFHELREERLRSFIDGSLERLGLAATYRVYPSEPNTYPNERLGDVKRKGPAKIEAVLNGAGLDITPPAAGRAALLAGVKKLLDGKHFRPGLCRSFFRGGLDDLVRCPAASDFEVQSTYVSKVTVDPKLLSRLAKVPLPFGIRLRSGFALAPAKKAKTKKDEPEPLEGALELVLSAKKAEIEVSVRWGMLPDQQTRLEKKTGVRFEYLMDA